MGLRDKEEKKIAEMFFLIGFNCRECLLLPTSSNQMSVGKKYIAYNFTKPVQEGESPVPNQDGCFPMLLACYDGNDFRKCVNVNSKTPNTFKYGELLVVFQMSAGELTNGSIVKLDDTVDIQKQFFLEQCTGEAVGDRVVYTIGHVEVSLDHIIDLGCYRNNIIGDMEDPKRLISPGCYHSIIYQVVPCEDNSYRAIVLSANEETYAETELAKKLEMTHFEKMPEIVKVENDCQIKTANQMWEQIGRIVLEEFDKSNAIMGIQPIFSLVDESKAAAFDSQVKQSQLMLIKVKQDEEGKWIDDDGEIQIGTAFPDVSMKCKIKLKPCFAGNFDRIFKIGDFFRVEATLSTDYEAFWTNANQEKSEVFLHTVNPDPDAAEEERFQGILEGKAMEKELLDQLKDKQTMPYHLNRIQHQAVMMALNDERKLVCIQGPPGTGKSHTLAVLIAKIIQMKRKEVVKRKAIVLTPTREACKNLMEMSKEMAKKMRLPDLHEHTFMDQKTFTKIIEECPEQQELAKIIAEWEKEVETGEMSFDEFQHSKKTATSSLLTEKTKEIMLNVRVVFSTIASTFVPIATKTKGFENAICIIDEAGQVKESDTWPAVVMMKRIVMAGDPSQLPAVVMSAEARDFGLDDSLMKRIEDKKELYSWIMLEEQYRSHGDITEWSSKTFYNSSIQNCGPSTTIHELMKFTMDRSVLRIFDPFVLIDTSYEDEKPASFKTFEKKVSLSLNQLNRTGSDLSYANQREAEIVVAHYLNLRKLGICLEEIAIITPYRSQKELIEKLIREQIEKETKEKQTDVLDFDQVKIGTVDSYQGQEFLAVIFSMVRSNPKFHLGFVQDLRRLNVAITRAKRHFMLVGNGSMLHKSRLEEIKNLFNIFVRDRHRFPPAFVYGKAIPYHLESQRTNFGMDLKDFFEHCQYSDPQMAEHCKNFVARKNMNRFRGASRPQNPKK